MNQIVYLSSDEEDEKPKNIGHRKSSVSEEDDCVVLDGDPYKTTAKENAIDACESDDVLVVGQKGEIACRDYPHSRHACAKYPFNSTSHQSYCDMCHCYVCDTPAPCAHWSEGFSNLDHCHANDKDQLWKDRREWIRTGKLLPVPVSKPALQRVSLSQSTPLPHNSSSPVTQFGSIQLPHNSYLPVPQSGIRACSSSISVATHPNTYISPAYRPQQPRTFPQDPGLQPRGGQLYQNHRGGSYNGNPAYNGNPGPQVVSYNSFTRTQTPSGGVIHPENSIHNIAQGSPYTGCTPPIASQGNPQIVPGFTPTLLDFHNMYAKQFSGNMYSGNNVQAGATVPSQIPNPHVNQQLQQHSGKSNDTVWSEFEDWLMDTSTTMPVCPIFGQDNTTT